MQTPRVIILGVCGKLMAGVAKIAVERGHTVIGYDQHYAPPMSEILMSIQMEKHEYYPETIDLLPQDQVIVGNQLRPSEPIIQFLIRSRVKLYSAPQWLAEYVLQSRYVIAVTGSHGKTTITAMIADLLTKLDQKPGYLIGGVLPSLGSAKLGEGKYFVIESDEYDAAFFDKRPKFHHYWPSLLVVSDVEYDHADIFNSLEEIILQFKYLMRLLPKGSPVISTMLPKALNDQIKALGHKHIQYGYEPLRQLDYHCQNISLDLSVPGQFNYQNAIAAYLVGQQLGLNPEKMMNALNTFSGVLRRQVCLFDGKVKAYDDFAHHPSAVEAMIKAFEDQSLVVLYHPATYTQRMGEMDKKVISLLKRVNKAYVLVPPKHQLALIDYQKAGIHLCKSEQEACEKILQNITVNDHVIVMSAYYLSCFWEKLLASLSLNYAIEDCIMDYEQIG